MRRYGGGGVTENVGEVSGSGLGSEEKNVPTPGNRFVPQ
jgi:hypothetical protein